MLGEIALAIEMGADAVDIGKTIHPPPTLGESIGMAMEPMRYNARHCERTLLYQTLAEHYETWLVFACAVQFDGQ
eukprot:gene17841-17683_t